MNRTSVRLLSLILSLSAVLGGCAHKEPPDTEGLAGTTHHEPLSSDKEETTVNNKPTKPFQGDSLIVADPNLRTGEVSSLLYGACMEDVNHELYGGIWSQMIFGESFEESPFPIGESGFSGAGGVWSVKQDGEGDFLYVDNTPNGPKLLISDSECTTGAIEADVRLDGEDAGFIVKTSDAAEGADAFNGYEIALINGGLRLGKHLQNYTHISDTPCVAPQKSWIHLRVEFTENSLSAWVDGTLVASYTDPAPIRTGSLGFRSWNAAAGWKNVRITTDGAEREVSLDGLKNADSVSGMWRTGRDEGADGHVAVITDGVYNGKQAQHIEITQGSGRIWIDNMGLNRSGMGFVGGKDYNGYIYAKSAAPTSVCVAMESADGSKRYAKTSFTVEGDYQKYAFSLTPDTTDPKGRFVIEITSGAIDVDYAFLEPGAWGLYKGLHVRRDVGEMLENQGITVLRLGGCMANAADYKWKKMIGAPEDRGVYAGWWYPFSSYGFGIIEFMDLCEALGVEMIPDFSSYESASDMDDFIRFACGTDPSDEWVRLRREMGREEPYNLHYIQIGNEDRIDLAFAGRFNAIADKIWAHQPDLTLIVGDFEYKEVIKNPNHFTCNTSGITSLEGHKKILDNAVKRGGRVWFDIHFWSEAGADPVRFFDPALSLYDALKKVCPQADTGLCVLELNANAHTFERALCNAFAILFARRHSDVIHIMCSANALQVQGHNDNGWDQGLVFMDTDSVWYQPPAYVDRMLLDSHLPYCLELDVPDSDRLTFCALSSEDGKKISVAVVNRTGTAKEIGIEIPAYGNANVRMTTVVYADRPASVNTAAKRTATHPDGATVSENALSEGRVEVSVKGYSLTVFTFEIA